MRKNCRYQINWWKLKEHANLVSTSTASYDHKSQITIAFLCILLSFEVKIISITQQRLQPLLSNTDLCKVFVFRRGKRCINRQRYCWKCSYVPFTCIILIIIFLVRTYGNMKKVFSWVLIPKTGLKINSPNSSWNLTWHLLTVLKMASWMRERSILYSFKTSHKSTCKTSGIQFSSTTKMSHKNVFLNVFVVANVSAYDLPTNHYFFHGIYDNGRWKASILCHLALLGISFATQFFTTLLEFAWCIDGLPLWEGYGGNDHNSEIWFFLFCKEAFYGCFTPSWVVLHWTLRHVLRE